MGSFGEPPSPAMSARMWFESALSRSWPPRHWRDVTVLAAVSGGPDSVALLRALHAVRGAGRPGRLVAAHFHHGVRGAAADRDARFVADLARRLGLPCDLGRAASALPPPGRGLETAARQARYAFLTAAAYRWGARYVVTAHTADDQAETVLHRVVRGAGLAGLAGIPRARELAPGVALLRPLLEIPRSRILAYLEELGQPYCDDASNQDLRLMRNRIRCELLPLLASRYNPRVAVALRRLARNAAEAHRLVVQEAVRWEAAAVTAARPGRVVLDCRVLAQADPVVVRELIRRAWRAQGWAEGGMAARHWRRLGRWVRRAAADGSPGPDQAARFFPGAVRARRRGPYLELEAHPPPRRPPG